MATSRTTAPICERCSENTFERFSPVAGDQCFESQALGNPLAGPAKHGLVIDEEYVVTHRIDLQIKAATDLRFTGNVCQSGQD